MTSAAIEWTEEKLKTFIAQFRDGSLKIVNDVETYQVMKEQKKSPELQLFTKYVHDDTLRQLFRIGLSLRALEQNTKKRDILRTKIKKTYGIRELHIAEFIQNGFFIKILDIIMLREKTETVIRKELTTFFNNFEKNVTFIQETDNIEKKTREITTRIISNLPKTYIIFSSGIASDKCSKVKRKVMDENSEYYTAELYETPIKRVYFLNKKE